MSRLAWVTTAAAHGLDDDESLGLEALRRAGVEVDVVDWHDEAVDWASYDRAVLRSTWDYAERLPEFLDWLGVAGELTELVNPLPMVRWSLDKHYLAELEAAGVPVPRTTYVEPGEAVALPAGEVVVKPAVHAASKRVTVPRGDTIGDLFAEEALALHDADAEQLAVAEAAVDLVTARFGTPAYARIDLVRDDDGRPCVLEVELVEPSLFLAQGGPAAAERLAAGLAK